MHNPDTALFNTKGHIATLLLTCLVDIVTILFSSITRSHAEDFQAMLNRAGIGSELPRDGKAILINIPAFELIAFDAGAPVLRSRVIVGALGHRTPRLNTNVSAVRFRPIWGPTPSMVASGEYVDHVWPPVERNPLGLVTVRLQPGLLVYLHDTNRRELFAEGNRALSHGCIRVEKWAELAAFVLDVDLAEVHRDAQGRRTFDAPAPPIPVELGYYTRFVDPSGHTVTYADIYNLDTQTRQSVHALKGREMACAI